MTEAKIRIALSGKSGAGKTTVARHLVECFGLSHCNTGSVVRRLSLMLFDSESKTRLHQLTDAIQAIDRGAWFRLAIRQEWDGESPVVVDSIRYREDYALVKKLGFQVWRLDASKSIRFARLRSRAQEFDPDECERASSEVALDGEVFDARIKNEGSIEALYRRVEACMQVR